MPDHISEQLPIKCAALVAGARNMQPAVKFNLNWIFTWSKQKKYTIENLIKPWTHTESSEAKQKLPIYQKVNTRCCNQSLVYI